MLEHVTSLFMIDQPRDVELVCGLDISTAVTGVCIITSQLSPVFIGCIDTRKIEDFWKTADVIKRGLDQLGGLYTIKQLYVEEDLKRFRSGFSTAATLSTLSKINGIVSYNARSSFGIDPTYVKSSLARTRCGITLIKARTPVERRDPHWVKRQIFNAVMNMDHAFHKLNWPMTRATKRHPHGHMRAECFDMTDAYVIARGGVLGARS